MKRSAKLTVIGAGEAFDTDLGNNSCLLSGPRIPTLLLDCGYQIPERIWKKPQLARTIEAVFFSHLHADHAFGIVPLLMRYWEEKRKKPLWLIGHRGLEAYLRKVFDLGYPNLYPRLGFDLHFHEVRHGDEWKFKSLRLRFASTRHSVDNLSVRIDGPGRDPWSMGFSGDGALTLQGRKLFQDVDLLVQEVYSTKPMIPVHYDLQSLREYMGTARIRKIGVTHCSRYFREEIARKVLALKKKDPRWVMFEPGMEIAL